MGFPAGVETVTVTAPANGYRTLDGSYQEGTITLTPSVREVVSSEHGIIAVGEVNFTIGASGSFPSKDVLPVDADGFTPSGWTYRLDQLLTGEKARSYNISIPASAGTVDLSTLVEVEASDGTAVSVPGGGGGTPSDTVVSETNYSQAASAGAATAYSRGDHTHGTPALPTTGTTAGTYAAGDDSRLSDARTPTAHAASHAAAGGDPVTLTQAQITGLTTALAALAPLAGATFTGVVTIDNTDFTVEGTNKGFRFRPTGSALDLEAAGADFLLSVWSGTAVGLGTQRSYFRFSADAQNVQLAGKFESVASLYGSAVHALDPVTGVASLGGKNSLANILVAGRRATGGAPSTGSWAAGDTVQDAAGAWWFCTASGTPGTWVCVGSPTPWRFDVTHYGAVGDGTVVADGAMTSGSAALACATSAPFAAGDVGKAVSVKGAGPSGVTTLVTTIASFTDAGHVTLTDAASATITGAIVIFGTDDTPAVNAAVDAAEAYLAAGHAYAQVYFPPRAYVIAGALDNTKSGNGQIVFGPVATTDNKQILEFRGATDGAAAVRHWQQTVPQTAGSCLLSLGVYASTTAQTSNINADGNPGVISGPNEGSGYGVSAAFSNMQAVIKDLAILTTHSAYGLTYGAANLWGCANAHIENLGYGTAGVVTGSDYSSPGAFGTGLSVGLLLPAPGNNDHVIARNISCGGGYTYAMFLTEHAVIDRYMALYCWAGLVAVGTYAGSVGSVHSMHITSASIEACTHELYIYGAGSSGVGPTVYANISTESSTPNVAGSSTAAMNAALGRVVLTGLFTESGVSVSAPTGLELVDGQVPRAIKRKTGVFTCSPIDRTLVCDTASAGFTGTLPAADFCPVEYVFRNVGVNTLTVASTSSQSIYLADGTSATSAALANGESLRVQALYDGSAWGWYAV